MLQSEFVTIALYSNSFSVRSLGSVALKKAEDGKTDVHFNYFSLDFDEVSYYYVIFENQNIFIYTLVVFMFY